MLYLVTIQLPFSSPSPKYYRRRLDGSSKQAKFCEDNFGEAWLAQWNNSAKALCQPGSASGSTQLTCRHAYMKDVTSFSHQNIGTIITKIGLSWHDSSACCYSRESKLLCQALASNICYVTTNAVLVKNVVSNDRVMCVASSTYAVCSCNRSMDDQHMTRASRPHVLCDAVNLMVDPRHMLAAPCLKHRPNYLCNFGTTYNRYLPGAFGMACTSAIKSLKEFPRDHLQDIMDSMARITPETAAQVICISCLVTCLHSIVGMHALLLYVGSQQVLHHLHDNHQMCANVQLLCYMHNWGLFPTFRLSVNRLVFRQV